VGVGTVDAGAAKGGGGTVVSRGGVGSTTEGSGTFAGGTSWAGIGAATRAVDSHDSDLDFTCECAAPAADTEVLEERGEAGTGGVSDAVEISVSDEATVSGKSLRGDSAGSEASLSGFSGVAFVGEGSGGATTLAPGLFAVTKGAATTAGFGDSGGVGSRRALSRTSGGGRERGEMMIPGARDGSVGRRDQMAHPPKCCCFGSNDVFCVFVDVDADAGAGVGAGAEATGTGTWGVDVSDLEAWLEPEGGSRGGGVDGGEEGGLDAGAFVVGSGEGS